MTATATPATVAPRMHGSVLRSRPTSMPAPLDSPSARLHTDDDDPTSERLHCIIDAALNGEKAAQALANSALLDLAISEGSLAIARQALYDLAVQNEAYRAELEHVRGQLTAARPVIEMAGLVAHGCRGVADMRQAYTTYVEEGPR